MTDRRINSFAFYYRFASRGGGIITAGLQTLQLISILIVPYVKGVLLLCTRKWPCNFHRVVINVTGSTSAY